MGWRNVGLHVDGSFASGGTCVHADFEYQSPGSGQGPGPQAAASLLSQPRSSADKGNLTKNTQSLFADYVCVAHTSEKHIPTSYPHLVCDYHVQERVTEHRHFAACVPQDRVPFGKVLVIDCGWCACGHQKPVEQAQHNSHRHNSPSSSLAHTQSHD